MQVWMTICLLLRRGFKHESEKEINKRKEQEKTVMFVMDENEIHRWDSPVLRFWLPEYQDQCYMVVVVALGGGRVM